MTVVEPELRVRYDLTRDDYVSATSFAAQRLLRTVRWGPLSGLMTFVLVASGGVMSLGVFELARGYGGPTPQWLGWIGLAFVVSIVASVWQQRLRAARVYAAAVADDGIVLGPQELVVTPDALVHRLRENVTRLAWSAVMAVEEHEDKILIFLDKAAFYIVPMRAFSSVDERQVWLAAVREHSKTVLADMAAQVPCAPAVAPERLVATGGADPRSASTGSGIFRNLSGGLQLALLQRVRRDEFTVSAEAFAALVFTHIAVLFLLGFLSVGTHGQINIYELPRALLVVPLLLGFGLCVARSSGDTQATLLLAVALIAAGTVVSIIIGTAGLLMRQAGASSAYWRYVYYLAYLWWGLFIVAALVRLVPVDLRRQAGNVLTGFALLLLPSWFLPQGYLWTPTYDREADKESRRAYWALAEEKGFYAQQDALPRALAALQPERPGVVDLYLVAAGFYASEDVFMKEVKVIETLFRERFDTDGRSLALINNAKTLREYPLASLTSLSAALRHVGKLMNTEEDVLVLYVSSHGSESHRLSVEFWPLRLDAIDPPALKRALADSGIKWKVVVVSACYAGGFVEPLKDDTTVVITASDATRKSFGCGNESDATYLAKALFDEELRKSFSFEQAFDNARKSIEARERGQGYEPSRPQIHVGSSIRDKLSQIEQRLAALASMPPQ